MTLEQFLLARLADVQVGNGTESLTVLQLVLSRMGIARGTLDRYPIPYAQGVVEGIRQALCCHAVPFAQHQDYDPAWRVIVEEGHGHGDQP